MRRSGKTSRPSLVRQKQKIHLAPPETSQRVRHQRAHPPAVVARDQVLSRERQVRPGAKVAARPVQDNGGSHLPPLQVIDGIS